MILSESFREFVEGYKSGINSEYGMNGSLFIPG